MEDKERANKVLKIIGEMPYFDPEAIVKVLVNEFALIRKEAAQQSVKRIVRYVCPNCGSGSETYHSADCPANPHNR